MVIETDVGWNTRAMALPRSRDGMTPAIAANLVREFAECPVCEHPIDPDVTDAHIEDRDVLWETADLHLAPHTCPNCGTAIRILVEEKAFGVIGDDELPDTAAETEDLYFIPVEDADAYLFVNPFQIRTSPVPQTSAALQTND